MGQALKKQNKKNKVLNFKPKEEYFINHGNILLEKRIALTQGQIIEGQVKILSAKEIESAIRNSEPNGALSNTLWNAYEANLEGRVCGIWVCLWQLEPNPQLTDRVLTDISTRMVMNHDNILKIYGCCLETCIPMPAYEFWPNNQTLFEHLHGSSSVINKRLKWVDRLRIATDVSYALSYMHNALPKPVVHRAVQSLIVLLGDSFHAKLGNFGYSMVIEPGETSHRWPVEGVPGYIDPEYIETQVVTDKCDVYSFGVLMLELLTGRNPIAMSRGGMDLVKEFALGVEKNCMMKMIDKAVMEEASSHELDHVAQLALTCGASKGEDRPTMIEVVCRLWKVQGIYNN